VLLLGLCELLLKDLLVRLRRSDMSLLVLRRRGGGSGCGFSHYDEGREQDRDKAGEILRTRSETARGRVEVRIGRHVEIKWEGFKKEERKKEMEGPTAQHIKKYLAKFRSTVQYLGVQRSAVQPACSNSTTCPYEGSGPVSLLL